MRTLRTVATGLALALAVAATGSAQTLALKGGLAHPTVGGADATGAGGMNTFAVGAALIFPASPSVALSAEALYANKGASANDGGVSGKLKISYLEIPLLARVTFPLQNSEVKPNAFAGPYFALKAACSVEGRAYGLTASASCSDAEATVKSVDFGVTLGGGVAWPINQKVSALAEARYDIGLTTIDDSTPASDLKNRSLMLLIGVSFPIGPGKTSATRTH